MLVNTMNMHDSRPYWDNAELSSPTSLTYPPVDKSMTDAECARPAHTPALSPAELATPWPRSPSQEPPREGPSSTEMYQVDLDQWHPAYEACVRFFLDEGQHAQPVQSLFAFLNMRLPCQRTTDPITRFSSTTTTVSLRAYLRRLVVTAHDTPAVLQALFGPQWAAGLSTVWQQERLNYLFTAKSGGWAATKAAYDVLPDEQTPFLRPLRAPTEEELRMAESRWSEWLAMEDWMVGPRSPW